MESISLGQPTPLGVTKTKQGHNFAVFAPTAKNVTLCLFNPLDKNEIKKIHLNPEKNRTGQIWHVELNSPENFSYGYEIHDQMLLDPYAKEVCSNHKWGDASGIPYRPLGLVTPEETFDWGDDKHPRIPLKDLIIYEMHVRGFTQHASSQVKHRGNFLGIIEKIPHLLELGVNAVELLPIQEFNEQETSAMTPKKEKLFNYWGYSTVNFFSLMNRYASEEGSAVRDFKTLVKALHAHGIEVILDIVYNHTSEGNEYGEKYTFKGFDPGTYYLLNPQGNYLNYTGCGNTVNGNRPVTRRLIIDALRYLVKEMHVDGFRFDLASIYSRDRHGRPLFPSPLIEEISEDPILAETKLIAEAWDAAGLYQVGHFYTGNRWSEWNDRYRDCMRNFIKGTAWQKGEFATRLSGSNDINWTRSPLASINFITAHDGFTLADLVSYNQKHNLDNGENNRDGHNNNISWNCGAEGATSNPKVLALRDRQMKNFHTALMVSQGVPMMHMGDEYGHSKRGNNNTWCQDNVLNWFLWNELEKKQEFYRFYRLLIQLRKTYPVLRRDTFFSEKDVDWHGIKPLNPHWEDGHSFIACTLKGSETEKDLYIAFNASNVEQTVHLPEPKKQKNWRWLVNTANKSPNDVYETEEFLTKKEIKMIDHSCVILEG